MCDARVFWPQIAELSASMAVTVAPITQGERMDEIASGLLDLLPHKFALAGLGMGGMVALEIARRAPNRVSRLGLIDTSPLGETPQTSAMRELRIVKAKSGKIMDVMREEVPQSALAAGPNRPAIIDILLDMADTLGPGVYLKQARALQRCGDQQAVLRKLRCPTLVMCGEADTINPVKRHSFMAELIPHAVLQVIAGAGHVPTLEQPQAVTEALINWMRQPYVLK
jgi:pimeloyl-ACP methyl ester carboxylesterase